MSFSSAQAMMDALEPRLLLDAWNSLGKFIAADGAANDYYGYSVAVHGDYAIVGADQETKTVGQSTYANAGGAYIYQHTAYGWAQTSHLFANDAAAGNNYGYSVA